MAGVRHFVFWNFWSTDKMGCLMSIAVPHFTKISQTVAEISHLTIFKMNGGRPPSWIFKSLIFEQPVSSGELICTFVQNFDKIGQNGFWDIVIFQFSRWPPSAILDFEIFKFLVSHQGLRCIIILNFIKIGQTAAEILRLTFFKMTAVGHLGLFKIDFWTFPRVRRANVRQHAKFHRNRSNHCWNIAIYTFFQDGGRPPFWICGANFRDYENFMFFITVQNLLQSH